MLKKLVQIGVLSLLLFVLASFSVYAASLATPSNARLIDETIREVNYFYADYEVTQRYEYDDSDVEPIDVPSLFSSSSVSVSRSQLKAFARGRNASGTDYIIQSNVSNLGAYQLTNSQDLNGISYFGFIIPIDQLNLPHSRLKFSVTTVWSGGGFQNVESGVQEARILIDNSYEGMISCNLLGNQLIFSGEVEIFETDKELRVFLFGDFPVEPIVAGGAYFKFPVTGTVSTFTGTYEPIVEPTDPEPTEPVNPTDPVDPGGGSGGSSSSWLNSMSVNIQAMYKVLCTYYYSTDFDTQFVIKDSEGESYTFSWPKFRFQHWSIANEDLISNYSYYSGSLLAAVDFYFQSFMEYFDANVTLWRNWFYPLKSDNPLYWRFFNTDTSKQENTNLAGVLYHISWYLGQMFQMNTWDAAIDGHLQDAADSLDSTVDDYDQAEQEIFDSVSDHFSGFSPDASELSALAALAWVSEFLQKCFTALGTFAVPITVSLLLGVCMQFIGYFKYKG